MIDEIEISHPIVLVVVLHSLNEQVDFLFHLMLNNWKVMQI